jgi:endonuclease/exonuclease/phosphatase family metal-dependent hydrolase
MGVRIATWNIEWANALFDDNGRMLADSEPSARYRTTRAAQLAGISRVLTALDADAILVVEAPDTNGKRSTVRALETLAAHAGLRARRAVIGYPSGTEQEIAFLYDPDRIRALHDPQQSARAPRFDLPLHDGPEPARFSKPPLELTLDVAGHALHLIGVHIKSKAPHGAQDAAEFTRISLENRRKQIAQCRWLRGRVEDHLEAGRHLIVLGDFNDGPGLDEYEAEFGTSGVEIVMGPHTPADHDLSDPHARMALTQRIGIVPTTSRFWLAAERRYFEALLDFIMVSGGISARHPKWRIWHPFNDPDCAPLRDALLSASDHFPVTLDLDL